MKKQILFITMAVLFVGIITNKVQAQTLAPQPIVCLSADALNPIAGTPYTYSVTVPAMLPAGTVEYHWLVTQQPINSVNFLGDNNSLTEDVEAIGGTVLAAGSTHYDTPSNGTPYNEISLTWQSFVYDANNPVFVVIQVKNTYGAPNSCTTQNLKVFKIEPLHAFTLDIANRDKAGVTQSGYGRTPLEQCISPIVSATYNALSNSVDYDFGHDTAYYEITAANWSGQWKLFAELTNLDPQETVVSVEWAYTWPANLNNWVGNNMTLTGSVYVSDVNIVPQGLPTPPPSIGAAGQSIFLRVVIDHTVDDTHNYEGIADETFTLAIDGKLMHETVPGSGVWTVEGLGDVHHDNGPGTTPPCNPLVIDGFENDWALQTLKARPNMDTTTPAVLTVTP